MTHSYPLRHVRTLLSGAIVACLALPLGNEEANGQEAVDVLFIGNSYVYYNNLPSLLEGIAGSVSGPEVRTSSHLHGGYSLRRHLDDGHLPGVLEELAVDGHPWDRVVLQEQSRLGVPYADSASGTLGDVAAFHGSVQMLTEDVRELGADPLLYMTWAKKRFPNQAQPIADAYDAIGQELDASVAPVGIAWMRVLRERPEIELYHPDGSHPSPAGSYLAACVIYSTLTGTSPMGASSDIQGVAWETPGRPTSDEETTLVDLDAGLAQYLQRVAWETVARRDGR